MINVSEIINDPDFAQDIPVWRKTGQWVAGKFVQTEVKINLYGVVTACNTKDLEQVPEGDRVIGMMCFYTTDPIYTTHNDLENKGTSDEPEWRGERYKIVQILPEEDWGYYKGFGARKAGD
jgi:hypothetical protein